MQIGCQSCNTALEQKKLYSVMINKMLKYITLFNMVKQSSIGLMKTCKFGLPRTAGILSVF